MGTARVVARREVGGAMTLFAFDVPDDVRASYVRPGQYTRLELDSENGFFVLGSREQRSPWEIVIRSGGGVSDRLLAKSPDAIFDVEVTPALGAGFPVEGARGENVVVVVTAGAIAAARATIARRIEDGDAARTRLLIGARTLSSVPVEREIAEMRMSGVGVRMALSTESHALHDRGYVQHVLERSWLEKPWVFLAGAAPMIAGVRAAAIALGATPARVVSNV